MIMFLSGSAFSLRHRCLKYSIHGRNYDLYLSCFSRYRDKEYISNITYCDLNFRNLRGIPKDIPNVNNLHVDFRHNKIKTIKKGTLSYLSKSTEICLCGNKIKVIQNHSFVGLSQLLRLSLEENKLTEIHAGMWKGLSSLKELNLAENKIFQIGRRAFSPLQNLESLNLQSNRLREIGANSEYWGSLPKLHHLELSDNLLRHIGTKAFFGLKNLSLLYMSGNKLVHLNPAVFSGLNKVRELSISYNNASILQIISPNLSNVSELHVDRSQLYHLDSNLFVSFGELHILSLFKSQIRNIAEGTFINQQKLLELGLNNNDLTNISSGMYKGLARLQELYLVSNQIQYITKEPFVHLRSLKVLSLWKNKISSLRSNYWKGLGRLQRLVLSENLITKIGRKAFVFLKNCMYIYLQHNRIVSLAQGAFDGLTELLKIDARNNPILSINSNVVGKTFFNETGKAFYIDIKKERITCSFCLCQLRNAPMNVTLVLKHPIEYKHHHYRGDYSIDEYDYSSECCGLGYTWENLMKCEKSSYFRCRLQRSDFNLSSCGSNQMSKSKSVAHSNFTKRLNNLRALIMKTKYKLENIRKQQKKKRRNQRVSHNNTHFKETLNQAKKGQGPDFVTVCIIAISVIVFISVAGFTVRTLYAHYRLLATIQQNEEYEINENVDGNSKEDSAQSDLCHEDIF